MKTVPFSQSTKEDEIRTHLKQLSKKYFRWDEFCPVGVAWLKKELENGLPRQVVINISRTPKRLPIINIPIPERTREACVACEALDATARLTFNIDSVRVTALVFLIERNTIYFHHRFDRDLVRDIIRDADTKQSWLVVKSDTPFSIPPEALTVVLIKNEGEEKTPLLNLPKIPKKNLRPGTRVLFYNNSNLNLAISSQTEWGNMSKLYPLDPYLSVHSVRFAELHPAPSIE